MPVPIYATACYDLQQARHALGLAASTLEREIALGRIRHAKRGGKTLLLGSWLLEWVAAAAEGPGGVAGRPGGAIGDVPLSLNGEQAPR
jgi:hypothetical protein